MSTVNVTSYDNLSKVGPPNPRRPHGRPHKKRNRTEHIGKGNMQSMSQTAGT
ncbi:hypothetical protein V1522DRAFT_412679 [Lipomyces starkeyi]